MSAPSDRLRAGIVLDGFASLAGAVDFIVSLADAMERTRDENKIVLLYRRQPPWWTPRPLARWGRAAAQALLGGRRPPRVPREDVAAALAALRDAGLPAHDVAIVGPGAAALERFCRASGIGVVLPLTDPLPPGFAIPWVGYLFDFQHRHLPRYFPQRELRRRDRHFAAMLGSEVVVVVNARAVGADAARFVPDARARIIALPFSAAPRAEWFAVDPANARQQYRVGACYFLISNQFWIHKLHDVAFAAFARIAAAHPEAELVCTGDIGDPRAPDYYPELERYLADHGIAARVHILGRIPKVDQIALMRGCIAVIQPTAFEGGPGGGSVFDAVALGVPTIVSDIPVNREIEPLVTRFVQLADAPALAAAMVAALRELRRPAPAPTSLLKCGAARRLAMGRALWEAAELAVALHRGAGQARPAQRELQVEAA